MRRKDAIILNYFAGMLTMISILIGCLVFIPQDAGDHHIYDEVTAFLANLYTFRFILMVIALPLAASLCVKVFKDYKINYMFIMELDPHYKVTHIQLLRVSLILLTIWAFCLLGQMFVIKFDQISIRPVASFTLAASLLILILFILPFHFFYRTARLELFKIIFEVMISPFSQVTFKHFIVADIFTSFISPLKDLGTTTCFFFRGLWLDSKTPNFESCPGLRNYNFSIMIIPFWFRFAQSLRRYRDNKLKWNLVNAAKYVSLIIQASLYITYEVTMSEVVLWCYISYAIFNTVFCVIWDYYIDWGLLRSF
jgi:hypothetical protein